MTVLERLSDFPEGTPAKKRSDPANSAQIAMLPAWPAPWQRRKVASSRTLAFLWNGLVETEHGNVWFIGADSAALQACVCEHNLLLFVDKLTPFIVPFARARECLWSASQERIVGFKFRAGRRSYMVLEASTWCLSAAHELKRLRRFLDSLELGDCATPATLGAAIMARLFPAGRWLRRPPWPAWHDLHDSVLGGRTEALRTGAFRALTEFDLDNAYARALADGAPHGQCMKLFKEEHVGECAWTYCKYRWTLPDHPQLDGERLGTRLGRARLLWVHERGPAYEGWYTGAEVRAARLAGYHCEFVAGWGWPEVSPDFAEWSEWMAAARSAYKARGAELEETWIKLATVGAIGRFGMSSLDYQVTTVEVEEAMAGLGPDAPSKSYGLGPDAISVTPVRPKRQRNYLLPQLAIHVHSTVRLQMDAMAARLRREGCLLVMRNIDAWYVSPSDKQFPLPASWKEKLLTPLPGSGTIVVQAAGWIEAGNLTKKPGVKR